MPLTYPNCSSSAQSCQFPCCTYFGNCPSSYSGCYHFYDPNDYSLNAQQRNCRAMVTNTKVHVTCKLNQNGVAGSNGWTESTIISVTIAAIIVVFAFILLVLLILWCKKECQNEFVNQWAKNIRNNAAMTQQRAGLGQQINGFSPERANYQTIPLDSSMVQPFNPRELDVSMNRLSRET